MADKEWLWNHRKGSSPLNTAILEELEKLGRDKVDATQKTFLEILHSEFVIGPLLLEREAHIDICVK